MAAYGDGDLMRFSNTCIISKKALKEMNEKWDVKINTLPEAEVQKMRDAAKKVWDEIAQDKDPMCKQAIDMLYEFLNEVGSVKK